MRNRAVKRGRMNSVSPGEDEKQWRGLRRWRNMVSRKRDSPKKEEEQAYIGRGRKGNSPLEVE
jgi:hypothetical protein